MPLISKSQDIHFSQYHSSPLNLNPSLTGIVPFQKNINLNYRTQWASVTVPYQTSSAGLSLGTGVNKTNDWFGFGLLFNSDRSGDGVLTEIHIKLSSAYHKKINTSNTFSGGIQIGYIQKSFDLTKLSFGNQFDGDRYNSTLGNQEDFLNTQLNLVDFSGGLHWLTELKKLSFAAGISLFHINRPTNSFYSDETSYLPSRLVSHGNISFHLSKTTSLIPSFLYTIQGPYQESISGLMIKHKTGSEGTSLSAGCFRRAGDAVVLHSGIEYSGMELGFSYDINTSELSGSSRSQGGFEIAFSWLIRSNKSLSKFKLLCPVF